MKRVNTICCICFLIVGAIFIFYINLVCNGIYDFYDAFAYSAQAESMGELKTFVQLPINYNSFLDEKFNTYNFYMLRPGYAFLISLLSGITGGYSLFNGLIISLISTVIISLCCFYLVKKFTKNIMMSFFASALVLLSPLIFYVSIRPISDICLLAIFTIAILCVAYEYIFVASLMLAYGLLIREQALTLLPVLLCFGFFINNKKRLLHFIVFTLCIFLIFLAIKNIFAYFYTPYQTSIAAEGVKVGGQAVSSENFLYGNIIPGGMRYSLGRVLAIIDSLDKDFWATNEFIGSNFGIFWEKLYVYFYILILLYIFIFGYSLFYKNKENFNILGLSIFFGASGIFLIFIPVIYYGMEPGFDTRYLIYGIFCLCISIIFALQCITHCFYKIALFVVSICCILYTFDLNNFNKINNVFFVRSSHQKIKRDIMEPKRIGQLFPENASIVSNWWGLSKYSVPSSVSIMLPDYEKFLSTKGNEKIDGIILVKSALTSAEMDNIHRFDVEEIIDNYGIRFVRLQVKNPLLVYLKREK